MVPAKSVTDAVAVQAIEMLTEAGLAGLLPQKRGPRSGHKLTPELMQFVTQLRLAEPAISSTQIAQRVAQRFGVSVHPRSIDRQLRHQKNSGESRASVRFFGRSAACCSLRGAPISSRTRIAARTWSGTDHGPRIPLLAGSF